MKALERVTFRETSDSLRAEREKLAQEAKTKLGYAGLSQTLPSAKPLLAALKEMDIHPFESESVKNYKFKKTKSGMWSGTQDFMWCLTVVLAWDLVAVPIVGHFTDWERFVPMNVVFIIMSATGLFATLAVLIGFGGGIGRGSRITRSWQRVPIHQYTLPIPEFAIERALQIKKAIPDANLSIDQLIETEDRNPRPAPDPFLVVTLGDESYWVDVWNEAEYEKML